MACNDFIHRSVCQQCIMDDHICPDFKDRSKFINVSYVKPVVKPVLLGQWQDSVTHREEAERALLNV